MSENLEKAFSPARLGKLERKNRIIKASTYEGKTPDGIPGDLLLDFHKAVLEGGTAMTTIGYCTTEDDGRINDQMMWMHDGIRDRLTHMNTELKKTTPEDKISGQMTNRNYKNGCTHCNKCATLIEAPGGVYCPLNQEAEAS